MLPVMPMCGQVAACDTVSRCTTAGCGILMTRGRCWLQHVSGMQHRFQLQSIALSSVNASCAASLRYAAVPS